VGGLIAGFDQLFMMILAVSIMIHSRARASSPASRCPRSASCRSTTCPDRFRQAGRSDSPSRRPKPKKEEAKGEEEEGKEGKTRRKKPRPPATRRRLKNAVASKGLLKVLTSSGAAGGAFEDVLGNSNATGSWPTR